MPALLGPLWSAEQRSRTRGIGKLAEARDGRVVCRPASGEQRRAPEGQESGGRVTGVCFSLLTLLLHKQEKVSRPPAGGRNQRTVAKAIERRAANLQVGRRSPNRPQAGSYSRAREGW